VARIGRSYPAVPLIRAFRGGKSAAVTGTATASITETDVVAGGKTIIITLTGDTWIAAGAGSFDLQRDEILQGLDSAQSEALGWNLQVRDLEVLTAVVRTSDTVVTITLTAKALYDITAQETITVTVPGTALVGTVAIVATPTFTVDTISLLRPAGGKLIDGILLRPKLVLGRLTACLLLILANVNLAA
jgi:hypothetical protein